MSMLLTQSRDIILFIPVLQEIELGDRFLLSMLHWCGIGKRSTELQFWEVSLAMDGTTPLGVCGLYQNPGMPKHLAWVAWLGIRRSARRQGAGAAMLDALILHARSKHGFSELWVYTDGDKPDVHRYYERGGFRYVGEGGDLAPDVVMSPSDKIFRLDLVEQQLHSDHDLHTRPVA